MSAQSRFLPACVARSEELPWVPAATPGKSSKLLRVLPANSGFVELLRLEPGVIMPLHRHTGEVHAWNLSGRRQLCTGEVIGPGDYVFEPPGNEDWWKIVGDEVMVVLVVVIGEVEFLGPGGEVRGRASAASQYAAYEDYCREQGLEIRELGAGTGRLAGVVEN